MPADLRPEGDRIDGADLLRAGSLFLCCQFLSFGQQGSQNCVAFFGGGKLNCGGSAPYVLKLLVGNG